MHASSDALERLVDAVLASTRYRFIAPDLVRKLATQELAKGRTFKEAVKATRNRLHQVGGAFLADRTIYPAWLEALRQARESGDEAAFRRACLDVMRHHASTRERLPILDRFYVETLAGLGPIRSVLDLACGLNPLAIPWMPLAPGAEYLACDIYADLAAFIDDFLPLAGVAGQCLTLDVSSTCPDRHVHLALLLKAVPCLEQIDSAAGSRLLRTIQADHLLVSFPTHSLGGKRKGMTATYDAHFSDLLAGTNWTVRRFAFPGELAFLASR
jgi:16S rRNA (guanine(1405)-N(7))-methyltransferase